MSTTRDSSPQSANEINANWTSTSGPGNRSHRALLSADRFNHPEVVLFVARQARVETAGAAGARGGERTEGPQVGSLAVHRVVGTSRPRNGRELRVDRHRLGQ